MPQGATLRLDGYREFMVACAQAEPHLRRRAREVFRTVGHSVQRGAASRIAPRNARTAAGYKTVVRQRGIAVEQSLRKTTGGHPEWGGIQMRQALMPALEANEAELLRDLERAIDRVADQFETRP